MQSKLYDWRQKEYDPKRPDGTGGEGTGIQPDVAGAAQGQEAPWK